MEEYYWLLLFVSLNAIILLLLAANISVLRIKNRISYGDGGNKLLAKAIRVHGNGVEQVPIFAFLLLALTYCQMRSSFLAVFAILFTLARIMHACGMLFRIHIARQVGAGITYLLQGIAAVSVLVSINA